jgi:hypothetical protein
MLTLHYIITLIIINSVGVSHRRVKVHGVKMTLRAIKESDVVAVVLAFSLYIELVPDLLEVWTPCCQRDPR